MSSIPVNYWAVIVSAIINVVLGFLWFGPLFGKKWAHLAGISRGEGSKSMTGGMIVWIIGTLLMSYVLAQTLVIVSEFVQITGVQAGLTAAFWAWIGFVVPVTAGTVVSERKFWKLWAILAGYYLVALLIAGAVLASWM
jgi:hypothetical protein